MREENAKQQKELSEELRKEKNDFVGLVQEATKIETQNQIKQTELARIIKQIKQCLKIPPDLAAVLKDAQKKNKEQQPQKGRFKNSNDILQEIKSRNTLREKNLSGLTDTVSRMEITAMNKKRKIKMMNNILNGNEEKRLKMLLFVNWMSLLV